ncbi:MAG: hypothetical protein AB1390_10460 [Nitrospirota bacterium]
MKLRRVLFISAGIIALFILVLVIFLISTNLNVYKPRIETLSSDALAQIIHKFC